MKLKTLFLVSIFSLFVSVHAQASWVLYGVNSSDDGLSQIDPQTCEVNFIGPLDPNPNLLVTPVAMAVRPTDGKIFVWNNSDEGITTGVLLTVDPGTGLATPVDPATPGQGVIQAIAFSPDGEGLFGSSYAKFYKIDPDTGEKILEYDLDTSLGPVYALDFSPQGVLYGVSTTNKLVTIDTTNGEGSLVADLSIDIGVPGSIVFDPATGLLIGSGFGGDLGDILFHIDPADGNVSIICSMSRQAPQGMGFVAEAPVYMSVTIEDAPDGVPVYKVAGDGLAPAHDTYVEIVTTLLSTDSSFRHDIPVALTIPDDLLGQPVNTWVRDTPGSTLTPVAYDNLGDGRYRVTTDLHLWQAIYPYYYFYLKQVVWRFRIPTNMLAQDIVVSGEVGMPSIGQYSEGTIRILAPGSAPCITVANRTLLYQNFYESSVTSLLQRLFTEAQGPPASHSPRAVIYYVDRYDNDIANWDNTNVDYTSEADANEVANAIDAFIEDWVNDSTQYEYIDLGEFIIVLPISRPTYLLIVGDDDTLPFYRYNDPYDREQFWNVNSAANPPVRATDEDYILTDNPYADLGPSWYLGDIELSVGRLLGASAEDMLKLLEEGVDVNNGERGAVVMASVDGWELGLEADDGRADEIADLHDVTALFRNRGFEVRNDNDPVAEVQTIDVIDPYEGGEASWNSNFRAAANDADGMDLFFIGGHDSYDCAYIPGNDFTPQSTSNNVGTPNRYERFDDDHPIAMIVGCHGGLPVPDIDIPGGVNNSLVYDLIHEGARAYIGATGYSYGSPCKWYNLNVCLHRCLWAERLMQRFFGNLLQPADVSSIAIGTALAHAKRDFTFGFGNDDDLDRKTVTEFNLYGVPWAFISYPDNHLQAQGVIDLGLAAPADPAFRTLRSPVVALAQKSNYYRTFEVSIDEYRVATREENNIDYDLFSIQGGEVAIANGLPVLPYVRAYTLQLPFGAEVTDVTIVQSESEDIGEFNIPIAQVEPWSEGGISYTTETAIDYPYPVDADLVQYQQTTEGLLFTIFPVQHTPTTGKTWFYSSFNVQVTYQSPLTVTVTEFTTDKVEYMPGEQINTQTEIVNVGDVDADLTAQLTVRDALGAIIGSPVLSAPFSVSAGGSSVLDLSRVGLSNDGSYTAQVALLSQSAKVAGASAAITVLGGEITDLTVPSVLLVGEQGIFEVTFTNYRSDDLYGEAFLAIQSRQGGYVSRLAPQSIQAGPGSSATAVFSWTPTSVNWGPYTAIATVVADGQTYGPVAATFLIYFPNVEIDIKPDSDLNSINLKSKGVVPVAVLTTDDFDATTIDPDTVSFAEASPVRWTTEDVDHDGDLDMLFHFRTQELNLTSDSIEATLTGSAQDGRLLEGTDSVNIVPKGKKGESQGKSKGKK